MQGCKHGCQMAFSNAKKGKKWYLRKCLAFENLAWHFGIILVFENFLQNQLKITQFTSKNVNFYSLGSKNV